MTDRWHQAMGTALAQATRATEHGDVPVGAVVVDPEGVIVAQDHNRREQAADPTAHAEILALRSAAVDGWRLDGHTLVVTLEPCAMCAGAAVAARLERIVYGAADLRAGACWSLYNIPQDERLNHTMELVVGVREDECATLLDGFFAGRRLENRTDSP
ncbi:MAG: nucleoside deaminase [Acidimicrobiia bacterium]